VWSPKGTTLRVIRCPTLQVSQFLFPGQRSDTFLTDHVCLLSFLTLGLDGGKYQLHAPSVLPAQKQPQVPNKHEARWVSPLSGFEPRPFGFAARSLVTILTELLAKIGTQCIH
jgi:hypothetical protein